MEPVDFRAPDGRTGFRPAMSAICDTWRYIIEIPFGTTSRILVLYDSGQLAPVVPRDRARPDRPDGARALPRRNDRKPCAQHDPLQAGPKRRKRRIWPALTGSGTPQATKRPAMPAFSSFARARRL